MKTKIIYETRVLEIPGDEVEISEMEDYVRTDVNDLKSPTYGEIRKELIRARTYHRMTKGELEVWSIGFDKKTCEFLEILPTGEYEELIRLRDEVYPTQKENEKLKNEICTLKKTKFWKRLKWLFTGVGK